MKILIEKSTLVATPESPIAFTTFRYIPVSEDSKENVRASLLSLYETSKEDDWSDADIEDLMTGDSLVPSTQQIADNADVEVLYVDLHQAKQIAKEAQLANLVGLNEFSLVVTNRANEILKAFETLETV